MEPSRPGIGPNVGLGLYPELYAVIDAWIARQLDSEPSKPEAILRLVKEALTAGS